MGPRSRIGIITYNCYRIANNHRLVAVQMTRSNRVRLCWSRVIPAIRVPRPLSNKLSEVAVVDGITESIHVRRSWHEGSTIHWALMAMTDWLWSMSEKNKCCVIVHAIMHRRINEHCDDLEYSTGSTVRSSTVSLINKIDLKYSVFLLIRRLCSCAVIWIDIIFPICMGVAADGPCAGVRFTSRPTTTIHESLQSAHNIDKYPH